MSKQRYIVMAKDVAKKWLRDNVHSEYRLRILFGAKEMRKVPDILRGFRDKKASLKGVDPIPDLGVKEGFDFVEVWSSDRAALKTLNTWFEKRGFETSGVW